MEILGTSINGEEVKLLHSWSAAIKEEASTVRKSNCYIRGVLLSMRKWRYLENDAVLIHIVYPYQQLLYIFVLLTSVYYCIHLFVVYLILVTNLSKIKI